MTDSRKMLKKENLLVLLLCGVLLFVICIPLKPASDKPTDEGQLEGSIEERRNYEEELEQTLAGNLMQIAGIGKTRVMITYVSSEETVYEEKGAGGFSSDARVVTTLHPKVQGVLVIAEGADVGRNNKTITDACIALLGVDAEKVKVARMK